MSKGSILLLKYRLIKTNRRLTFDIEYQSDLWRWYGEDDGDFLTYRAPNGYEIVSRSRPDIQTERLWLWGGVTNEHQRSGSMVFHDNAKRDRCYEQFEQALRDWADDVSGGVGFVINLEDQ